MRNDQSDRTAVDGLDLSLSEKLDSLPQQPGVYQFRAADGKVLYVGKASNLRSRVRQYFQRSRAVEPRIESMIGKIADLEVTVTSNEVEALILEANLVKKLHPRYNVLLKDDKSFPFIAITDEPFPRFFVTRRKIPGARTFGPYTDVKTMRFALGAVRKVFMVRSCNYDMTPDSIAAGKYKVCLDYHIKKCEGPCEGLVSMGHYNRMIDGVAQVLRGRLGVAVESMQQEMQRLSDELRFEEAARVRDRVRALEVYKEKQRVVDARDVNRDVCAVVTKGDDACGVVFRVREGKVVGSTHLYMSRVDGLDAATLIEQFIERIYLDAEDVPSDLVLSDALPDGSPVAPWIASKSGAAPVIEVPRSGEKAKLVALVRTNAQFWLDELEVQRLKRGEGIPHAVSMLQKDLRLANPPRRIECFDNSNIQGSDPVSSMVVFADGKPKKSEYRKYKVRSVSGPDDFETMREVIGRRYRRVADGEQAAPDLVVIDGGKGQLSSAKAVLERLGLGDLPVIGLAKRLEEIYTPDQHDPLMLPRSSASLKLLQRLRDEAHRFAITFHRSLRSKRLLQTELDLIAGIGKTRAKELLEVFGSVQGVKFATDEQLADVVGERVTETIREYFASETGGQTERKEPST